MNTQEVRTLKSGIRYVKTRNSFSTAHLFSAPKGVTLKNSVSFDGINQVRCIVVADRVKYDEFRRKGLFWRAGIHARIIWH